MTEIILDKDFALSLMNKVFNLGDIQWYQGYWYWVTDSKYRTSTRLDKFLYDQIHNPDDKIGLFASKFATFLPDRCVIAILKEVLKKVVYLSDFTHFGKQEYWQPASLTLQSGLADCEDINSLIYLTARLAGIPSFRLWNCIGNVKIGDKKVGHYWLLYLGSDGIYVIDGAYHPDTSEISMRTQFKLSGTRYISMQYIFNEHFMFKAR